jgi:hypothetical protein
VAREDDILQGINSGSRPTWESAGPYRVRLCSPLRRSPDAATWPTTRDVSQWAEPDVRPLGHATSTFIADKACRVSIPLAGDVPPQHLMSPVHSTNRRCAASAFNVPCPLRRRTATRPSCRRHACPLRWLVVRPVLRRTLCSSSLARYRGSSDNISISYALWTLWRSEIAQALQALVISFCFALGPTCRGLVSLYVPPLSYKREGA